MTPLPGAKLRTTRTPFGSAMRAEDVPVVVVEDVVETEPVAVVTPVPEVGAGGVLELATMSPVDWQFAQPLPW